jgi:Ser/Thr protein kinase RdoA (MazF antagonist)
MLRLKNIAGIHVAVVCINCQWQPELGIRTGQALRTMRMMHYAAWLGRRWSDPAFPHSFPWFNDNRYWSDHILELREQLAALDEEPLQLF